MPKYLVTLYYTVSINREVEAASPEEAREKAEREDVPREEIADCESLAFDDAVVQEEILPDGRHIPVE